jgi:uncharacterized protein
MAVYLTSRSLAALAGIGLTVALLAPAQAQFFDWGRPQRAQPFRDWFGGFPRYEPRERTPERERTWDRGEGPADFSHAPAPAQKKPEATTPIVVLGDANADWLAYGLEDAFSEKPELNVVRKHRTDSGLIRYDPRRDIDWTQAAREIIAAEKPKFIIMMVGNNDRQSIREKAPPIVRPAPGKPATAVSPQPAQTATPAPPAGPEQQAPGGQPATAEQPVPNSTPEPTRAVSYGPWEFHTEKWEVAYIKRVDATIAALKSAGVPVIWVGLPSQRGAKASADSSYLNEIYRSRAEKAGITYVDIWDGFVDEGGRFSLQGPDYEGQIRRLRSGDGVYFTKFGARKLALYVEREIERQLVNHPVPVALPAPGESVGPAANGKPGAPSQRPSVGPVMPLTAPAVSSDELLGGGRPNRAAPADASSNRVLTKGEVIPAPSGRADDFSWPRSTVNIDTNLEPTPASAPAADNSAAAKKPAPPDAAAAANSANAPVARRARTGAAEQFPFRLPFFNFFR